MSETEQPDIAGDTTEPGATGTVSIELPISIIQKYASLYRITGIEPVEYMIRVLDRNFHQTMVSAAKEVSQFVSNDGSNRHLRE